MKSLVIALAVLICMHALAADLKETQAQVFLYRTPSSDADHRFSYEVELLRLALEKTINEYGAYQLLPGKSSNLPRAMAIARQSEHPYIFKTSYNPGLTGDFHYPKFPIDRGIFSYRLCFVNEHRAADIAKADTRTALQKFNIGQGVGWLDNKILTNAGFTVREAPSYESLFPMLSAGRFDMVCRAQNEIINEWQNFGHLGGFELDTSFALYYPLPRFFWVHKSKPAAFARIQEGLERAYEDGSALQLWHQYYDEALAGVSLKGRRIFVLPNPYLKDIDTRYQAYFLTENVSRD
ncbi:hypothetical protein [Gilvimarinus sp. DA14]|uniref:hypothetical protein n=1 Tax=Gilvimarinus sp. DA14 TaxID=2956798 RepID=UPI0020B794EF|nr:hypothetical protein [Gilvimarinus sp. DA14]UTF59717.1 hypothetical protein NHM04_14780 [Gilvimarinus sp. DA14]